MSILLAWFLNTYFIRLHKHQNCVIWHPYPLHWLLKSMNRSLSKNIVLCHENLDHDKVRSNITKTLDFVTQLGYRVNCKENTCSSSFCCIFFCKLTLKIVYLLLIFCKDNEEFLWRWTIEFLKNWVSVSASNSRYDV